MSLRVYGVIMQDGQTAPKLPERVKLHSLRELSAVAEEGEYSANEVEAADTQRHLEVVTALFTQDAILPAPVGTVFRTDEVLLKWMDLHYVALSDALAWVEDRMAARVHINKKHGRESEREPGVDVAAVAAEVTRSLRRHAVSTIPLRNEQLTGIAVSSAYLVERQLWPEFVDAVGEERDKHPTLTIELTGPWPPYDFVRLQFGA